MACRVGAGLTAKSGENLAQPFPSVKKDALDKCCFRSCLPVERLDPRQDYHMLDFKKLRIRLSYTKTMMKNMYLKPLSPIRPDYSMCRQVFEVA
jgi:hypothetical protein